MLVSAFPNLTGAQIVELLFSSADDAGAAGDDATYGQGILNIGRAFQPRGAMTLAGTAALISLTDNGTRSGPMGDAAVQAGSGAIILDGYSRAYALDLIKTLQSAPQEQPLRQGIGDGFYRSAMVGNKAFAVSITLRQRGPVGARLTDSARMQLSVADAGKAEAVAALVVSRASRRTIVALGLSHGARSIQRQLAAHRDDAFIVAQDPLARTGLRPGRTTSFGVRHDLGQVALSLIGERGNAADPRSRGGASHSAYSTIGFAIDGQLGPARFSIGGSRLREAETVLGGRFSGALSARGSETDFLDATAAIGVGGGWSISGAYRRGITTVRSGPGVVTSGRLLSDAFAFDVAKTEAFAQGDRLAFRIAQPLRVGSGGLHLDLPVSYDYATRRAGFDSRFMSLAPTGREFDYEIAYGRPFLGGYVDLNGYVRGNPGHFAAMPHDLGGAIRFTLRGQ